MKADLITFPACIKSFKKITGKSPQGYKKEYLVS
jgi:hypothetical protein